MKKSKISFLIALLSVCLIFSQCEKYVAPSAHDLLGVAIGMEKEQVTEHLKQIGSYYRKETKRQEIWHLRDNPRYYSLVVGYDGENRVRFVTVFAQQQIGNQQANQNIPTQQGVERVRYEEFGDLSKARQNVIMAGKEYVWELPAKDSAPGYFLIVRGYDPNFINSSSLVTTVNEKETEGEEED